MAVASHETPLLDVLTVANRESQNLYAECVLKTLGVEPRRTIRIGLWSGEEQGLLGSKAYVKERLVGTAIVGPAGRSPVWNERAGPDPTTLPPASTISWERRYWVSKRIPAT